MAKFKTTADAAQELGVSRSYLRSLIYLGILKEGKHFINISLGKKRPTYRWDVEAINHIFTRSSKS